MPVSRRLARDPRFRNGSFKQMQGKGWVKDVQPAFHWHQLFHRAGEDLHAAAVADEDHDFVTVPTRRLQELCQRGVFYPAGQIVTHQAKRLLAAEVMALEQAEELMNVGHGAPLVIHESGICVFCMSRSIGYPQRQRRVVGKDKAGQHVAPGGNVGVVRGVDLQQGIALVIEELNALPLAACGGFTDVKHARPLVEEQAQIQRARVQHQPGVAVQVLVGKSPDLLVYGVFVAADTFGFAHRLQRAQDLADFTAQSPGVVTYAGKGQLCFTDVH